MWFNSLHCPLNPPILWDFESCSPQIWGARGAWFGTLSLYETALPSNRLIQLGYQLEPALVVIPGRKALLSV
jgi:hypothetical protein